MSTPDHYFQQMYSETEDPWDFAGSWYELRRYGLLLASLPEQRYRVCFEPACSVGVLTEMLADRCDEVHAVDVVHAATEQARRRIAGAGLGHVRVRTADATDPWPRPACDLLVLSEFLYYTPVDGLDSLITSLLALVRPGGTIAACHWLGHSTDHACHGEDVHAALARRSDLTRLARYREQDFLLDVFRCR